MPRDLGQASSDLFGPLRPEPGDAVIHIDYGLGLFEGIETVEIDGQAHEVARLAYADGDHVMVPQAEFGSMWRYGRGIGVDPDKLKGSDWETRRDAALAEVETVARAVVERATERRARRSEPLVPDAARYGALCDAFPHTPTPGQAAAFSAVEEDLGSGRAMDRILLGDVGFGKTEVIARAAGFAALAGRQVAIAVPTTVLSRQHVATLGPRLEAAGLTVREYSSNVSDKEHRAVREGLADGSIDVVIGTHGLTDEDMHFDRLGLVIVDEEQKFGAKCKATLATMCEGGGEGRNRLVTTATPIPRVLTAAEVGLLDLSVLADVPTGRKPVETRVMPFDAADIARALNTEAEAGGRSYVICPRIDDIDSVRGMLAGECPDLSVAVAHGQMKNAEIDAAMTAFSGGEVDILLATALVENGLDIRDANTMVVLDADRFGLTQLHQLRGRIGRGERQAHLLVCHPEGREASEAAQARLAVLEEISRPGAGFDIAMADRNRRGGGDLLGEDQSGHLSTLGPGYYRHLLRKAMMKRRVRAMAEEETTPAEYPSAA